METPSGPHPARSLAPLSPTGRGKYASVRGLAVDQFLQHCLNAVMLGGTYALLGIGLTLIFGIMRVVNFTHGELYAFGAYMTYALVMIGAWIVLQNSEQLAWTGVAQSITTPFPADPIVIGSLSVSWNRVFVFAVASLLIASTYLLVNRTKLGKAMRATFQDRDTAALMGVRIERIHTATFALGSGLAAAAGALLGPVFVVTPTMGDLAATKAFAIVILGGLGNVVGATIGGFILSFAEEIGVAYVSAGYRDAMGFLLIIVILLVRPTGLFAQKERIS